MTFKNLAMRLTAGILSISAVVVPALAAAGTINTGSDKLNLRAQATTASAVLTKIPGGSTVEVLNTDNAGWYQISFSGMTGYVASQYVDLAQEAPAPAAPEASTDETVYGRVTPSTLNIRSAPSTSSEKCGKLRAGNTVEILETLNGWYRIAEGYISADYVTIVDAPAAATTPAADTAPVDDTVYGRITASSLNIRTSPSTTSEKCGKLPAGRVVEILEKLDGWYRIEGGYISSDYVLIVDASAAAASDTASQMVELALSYVGYPYVYGGSSPKGFDCSGFTSYICKQFGISINRTSSGQLDNGTPVSMSELLPGDIVIFKKYASSAARASHVGMYIGNGQFVHASTYGVGVIVSNMSDAYYTTGFVGGRRVV